MSDNNPILEEIKETVLQISRLNDIAYEQYKTAVDLVLSDRMTVPHEIEKLMDGMLDFCENKRFLNLYKKLCRHIYNRYPKLVGEHINLFRLQFEEKYDGNDNN